MGLPEFGGGAFLNSLAQSHIASFSDVPTIINRAETLKRSKYAKAAQGLNAEFVPFIVTVQGEFGPDLQSIRDRSLSPFHLISALPSLRRCSAFRVCVYAECNKTALVNGMGLPEVGGGAFLGCNFRRLNRPRY
jgi:hypothetical protein